MARGVRDKVDAFDHGGPDSVAAPASADSVAAPAGAEGPSPVDVHVGARIKLRRALLGLSQEKLGEALGLTFQQVQKYERGANRVSASRLHDIARVLDVPISFFFDDLKRAGAADGAPGRGFGFAEQQEAFGLSPDVLERKETIDLVGAYWRIADPAQRRRVLDLVKGMAPPAG